ncbi:phosphoserine transaminase [Entomobacter blattae]|nr:phosphoserine transaminase [Entomobacter blattae]
MLERSLVSKPSIRPANPCFSSGPCAKRPGWSLSVLQHALLGRSHRSPEGKERLNRVIQQSREVLGIPDGWEIGIVPASDTGAVEMILWSLAGTRPIDILAFESFSSIWATDIIKHLEIKEARVFSADYGQLPEMRDVNWAHDVVFVWNGTTSGVCLPSADVIPIRHDGLAICDATSAAFAMDLPWDRLDVVTWSWQKALGGEAAHGMLALSPKAVKRLEAAHGLRPLPRIFRLMTSDGKLDQSIFQGNTINTPSMLCVEDALDGLAWAKEVGGLPALIKRSQNNLKVIEKWVSQSAWIDFLAENPACRSTTSVCFKITASWFVALEQKQQQVAAKAMASLLAKEGVAFDIASYRDAPPGLRLWTGATVETSDVEAVLPWLDWAEAVIRQDYE